MSLILALPAVLFLLTPRILDAHQFRHPTTIEIAVEKKALLLTVHHDVDPGSEAQTIRATFDRNADGTLDEGEKKLLLGQLETWTLGRLKVTVDEESILLTNRKHVVRGFDLSTESPRSLGVTITCSIVLPDATDDHRLAVEWTHRRNRSHVPIEVRLADPWRLAYTNQGAYAPKPATLEKAFLAWGRPLILRVIRRATR